jgi:hypothetical protein
MAPERLAARFDLAGQMSLGIRQPYYSRNILEGRADDFGLHVVADQPRLFFYFKGQRGGRQVVRGGARRRYCNRRRCGSHLRLAVGVCRVGTTLRSDKPCCSASCRCCCAQSQAGTKRPWFR